MRELNLRSKDGLALFVRDYPIEGEPLGEPVLCLHGLTRNSRDFEIVGPRIAALGRRAIAVDVRGRGRSDWGSDPTRYALPVYAEDALRVLDQLGVARAVWLGTSMGGLISMVAAQAQPDRLGALILNDVGPVLEPAGLARIMTWVGKVDPRASWEEAADAIAELNGSAFPGANRDFWLTMARRTYRARSDGRVEPDYDPAIVQGFAAGGIAPDLSAALASITAPILLLRGALSDLLSREGVRRMTELAPQTIVAEVPNVGHAPTLEEPSAWLPIVDALARSP